MAIVAIGVWAGPAGRPIVALLITVAVLAGLPGVARDINRRLMDAVDRDLVDAAESALREVPGVCSVESVRMRGIGHRNCPRQSQPRRR